MWVASLRSYGKTAEIVDDRADLLVHLAVDGVIDGFADLDAATDQPVEPLGIGAARRKRDDGVCAQIGVRRDDHRLHADDCGFDAHRSNLPARR